MLSVSACMYPDVYRIRLRVCFVKCHLQSQLRVQPLLLLRARKHGSLPQNQWWQRLAQNASRRIQQQQRKPPHQRQQHVEKCSAAQCVRRQPQRGGHSSGGGCSAGKENAPDYSQPAHANCAQWAKEHCKGAAQRLRESTCIQCRLLQPAAVCSVPGASLCPSPLPPHHSCVVCVVVCARVAGGCCTSAAAPLRPLRTNSFLATRP